MALLSITSSNPSFSHVLRKNPASGLVARPNRKGNLFGWFSSEKADTYHLYFRDALNEVSYGKELDEEFEYLNHSRYTASSFILNAFNEVLADTTRKPHEADTIGFYNSITLHAVYLRNLKYFDIFKQCLPKAKFEMRPVALNTYEIKIESEEYSLMMMTNMVMVMSLFNIIKNEEYIDLAPQVLDKYLQSIKVIDAPYLIKYAFKANLLRSPKLFESYLPVMQSGQCSSFKFAFGSNFDARKNVVLEKTPAHRTVIDIGCGEGNYQRVIQKRLLGVTDAVYVAIDSDEENTDSILRKAKKYEFPEPRVFNSLDSFLESDLAGVECDVICTEVLEHMELPEAKRHLKLIFEKLNWKTVVITMPNKEFNKYYHLGDGVRNEDHKFEPSPKEFRDMIAPYSEPSEFLKIGDHNESADVYPTLGAVWKR